jgi:anti-sigma factor RsiW
MNAQHLSVDELADAAEGMLEPERAAFAESHLASCAECQSQSEALRNVTATLRAEPVPRMPEALAQRLNEVVATQSARRTGAGVLKDAQPAATWKPRPSLGAFGEDLAAGTVDGTPALLVYTKSDGSTQVTVVTGCGAGTPSAGPSAMLPP